MSFDKMQVMREVAKRRGELDLSQAAVASYLGIDKRTYERLESKAEGALTAEILFKLAKLMDLSIDGLLFPEIGETEAMIKSIAVTVETSSAQLAAIRDILHMAGAIVEARMQEEMDPES